jgi:RNA polymerase sigma-70 factor (ECF subfamily)
MERGSDIDRLEIELLEVEICVVRAQSGDRDAFRRLVEIYEQRLLYFIRRFLRDADSPLDVLQEVWLTVFRRIDSLRSPAAFKAWLYQIAHDKAIDLVRRQRREHELDVGAEPEVETPSESDAFDNAELVHRALEDLSLPHREVLTLRFLEDLEVAEIAEIIRCSVGTAKSRLHYANKALQRRVEELSHD